MANERQPGELAADVARLGTLSDRRTDVVQELLSVLREHDREMAALAERVRQLDLLVWSDILTGLLNRRGLEEEITREEARARRYQSPAVVALLKVVNLPDVHQRHGQAGAEALLRAVAVALRDGARGSDVVARIDHDTFAALLPGADLVGARVFLERVGTAAQFAQLPDGAFVPIRVHEGAATREEAGCLQDALELAGRRLHAGEHSPA